MAVPVHLLVAAAKMLNDPNTIKTVKSIYEAGTAMVDKAQGLRRAPPPVALPPSAPTTPIAATGRPKTGMRADMAKRWMLKPGASGDLIRFTYADEHGLVCVRTVGKLDQQRTRSDWLLSKPAMRA
ncbi:hypothetical protein [Blastomonas sp. AAP25]|uniref:hypothetical protein n=1 Tax=Blastomonas sp. AAP25 TaxID=1523416 RepID=UPI000B0EBC3F|nr:hypothetical protein [Blastomonas sp. AAP25]